MLATRLFNRSIVAGFSILLVLSAVGCSKEDTPISPAAGTTPPPTRDVNNDPYAYLLMPETTASSPHSEFWEQNYPIGTPVCKWGPPSDWEYWSFDDWADLVCEGTWNAFTYQSYAVSWPSRPSAEIWFRVTDLVDPSTTTQITPRLAVELNGGSLTVEIWTNNPAQSGVPIYDATITCPGGTGCAGGFFVWVPAALTGLNLSQAQVNNLQVRIHKQNGTLKLHAFELEVVYETEGGGGGVCPKCELD